MSKEHITYRTIDGIRYRCRDTGCDDLERAERNREMVAQNQFIDFWLMLEARQKEEEMREIGSIIRIRKR